MEVWDKIILGAGLYGLYAALFCAKRGERVLVLEREPAPFRRATYINQARVHQGYHYPRSLSTAGKCAHYFERFNADYGFCIHRDFEQIYATSAQFSWTSGAQFQRFCRWAGIPCTEVAPGRYFRDGMCDGAFLTREYTYDAALLRDYFLEQLKAYPKVCLCCGVSIEELQRGGTTYQVRTAEHGQSEAPFLLVAAYAGVNELLTALDFEPFPLKYELCEIILCRPEGGLRDRGFTVMDGPFFSIMPFGRTGLHSLTAVTFTPHAASHAPLPTFSCQEESGGACRPDRLGNCDDCPARPATAFPYMAGLARKYLREEYGFTYEKSLFSMKPILLRSELDDSRPTVIRTYSEGPTCVAVLSGKVDTVYDLDEVLTGGA